MPFEFGEITTPGGRRCLLIEAAGRVDLADGQAFDAHLLAGTPHHLGLVFARVAKGTNFSAELRRFFPTMQGAYHSLAAVTVSPIVRAAVNLMIRLSPRDHDNNGFRMFGTDSDALAWLDARDMET